MTQVKINGQTYDATVSGTSRDTAWGSRESKSITLAMDYETAMATFVDDVPWSILYQGPDYYDPETQQTVTPPVEEYDNSDYCMAGPITDNRDGTVTVKMGKKTDAEKLEAAEPDIMLASAARAVGITMMDKPSSLPSRPGYSWEPYMTDGTLVIMWHEVEDPDAMGTPEKPIPWVSGMEVATDYCYIVDGVKWVAIASGTPTEISETYFAKY